MSQVCYFCPLWCFLCDWAPRLFSLIASEACLKNCWEITSLYGCCQLAWCLVRSKVYFLSHFVLSFQPFSLHILSSVRRPSKMGNKRRISCREIELEARNPKIYLTLESNFSMDVTLKVIQNKILQSDCSLLSKTHLGSLCIWNWGARKSK